MALTKHTESNVVYLQVKHFSLWRELKKPVNGCEEIEVTNPKTGAVIKKHGYRFDSVSGHAVKLIKYDTENKYSTRYFGFKLHLVDGAERYVLDMPYQSQILRRFLRLAPNIDWNAPVTLSVFKARNKKKDIEELGVWFRQFGETVKAFYTREQPRGIPEATYDKDLDQWDFRAQHRWLIERLKETTIPDIEAAAAAADALNMDSAPAEDAAHHEEEREPAVPTEIDDDDVPF